jgi:hypothetical protein
MILKNYWAHSGYDAEELYFAKVNRELIERIRASQGKTTEANEEENQNLAEVIPFPGSDQKNQKKAA